MMIFFDLSTINYNHIINSVRNYCNNFCLYNDINTCDNINCLLYNSCRYIKEIKKGDKVKVRSLEWFNDNKDFIESLSNSKGIIFTIEMSKFCGKYVTISEIHEVNKINYYTVEELHSSFLWISEFFENINMSDSIKNLIKYCDTYCKFRYNNVCDNIDCPINNIRKQ